MAAPSKTIYVDMDDVLCQTARHFLVILEREFGKRIAYDQLTDFDIGEACRLTAAERAELYRIVHEPDELLTIEPIAGAIGALTQWLSRGYEIAVVTGRPPSSREPSLQWLAYYRVPYQSFTMVDKYGRFETENTAAITLAELATRRFALAVEDSLPMASYLALRMGMPVALLDCPWNRTEIEPGGIDRCRDWGEIMRAMPFAKTET
jgi:uncharacterized HAD superfamily protein